jgi:hypothetical protein
MPLKVKEEDTKEIQNPTEDYSALIQVDVLPSKFLPYPEKSEIYFKSYTFGEISKMSQSKVNASKKIDMALEGIQTKGFNKDNISYFDLQYISLLRRGSTFSTSDFSIRYTCRNKEVEKEGDGEEKTERCKHENFEILPLTNFEFIDLEIPKLPINVNFSNKKVKFNVDIEKFEEAYEFIQEVTGTDLVWLKKIDVLLNHGLKPFKLECRDCKYINYIGAGEGDVIIMPFCRTEDPHGDIISFG